MLLTTNTIQNAQYQTKETIKRNIQKTVKVVRVIGEIALLFVFVDTQKYSDLVQTKK